MRRILVTGANKGIGLAIVRGILAEHDDTFVLLGSRDAGRGSAAIDELTRENAAWGDRMALLEIDVARDESVKKAAEAVAERFGRDKPLYALVNNAGIGAGAPDRSSILEVNTRGMRRACEAFLPLLDSSVGRIVNITSGSAPSFVEKCSAERQRFFTDPKTDWAALEALMKECVAMEGDAAAFAGAGLGDGNAYGLSKACANSYTIRLALDHPHLHINACTPGFIETDLTRHYAESQGKKPADLGMKSPAEGARCPLYLLFGELEGNGYYYGSDSKRSPLHRYRSPGTPAFAGE